MVDHNLPYAAFTYLVSVNGPPLGGFSEVSGFATEVSIEEYRDGDANNHVHKVTGSHKMPDITLKRGIVKGADLWAWTDAARRNGLSAQREVVITLRDEVGADVQTWILSGALPMKYTCPTLNAKGGEVAIEELVLSAERIELESNG